MAQAHSYLPTALPARPQFRSGWESPTRIALAQRKPAQDELSWCTWALGHQLRRDVGSSR